MATTTREEKKAIIEQQGRNVQVTLSKRTTSTDQVGLSGSSNKIEWLVHVHSDGRKVYSGAYTNPNSPDLAESKAESVYEQLKQSVYDEMRNATKDNYPKNTDPVLKGIRDGLDIVDNSNQ